MVYKRDGQIQEFRPEKIENAVLKAFYDVEKEETEYAKSRAKEIAENISALDKDMEVEEIQDIVESQLAKKDMKVARKYIIYRNDRTRDRRRRSELMKQFSEKLKAKDVENQNANVDEKSFGGMIGAASDVMLKQYALDECMSELARNNHILNRIYTHDLNSYAVGMHNCLSIPFDKLLANGFNVRQTDVRPAQSVNTAGQLIAVIFQLQSLQQFGGVSATHIDWTLMPYVRKSFRKHYIVAYLKNTAAFLYLDLMGMLFDNYEDEIGIVRNRFDDWIDENKENFYKETGLKEEDFFFANKEKLDPIFYQSALYDTIIETKQAIEALYHNLNTLQSRSGNQLPFTSINYGTCTEPEGRMVIKTLLDVSIAGIGKLHKTSIFPCGIFQLKKGINRKPGEPNYDLYRLALRSTAQRLYPNYANCDWSGNEGYDPDDPKTYFSTMGCRTANGWDINGFGQTKDGRGNICPVTIIMPTLAMETKVSLEENNCFTGGKEYDEKLLVDSFMEYLDKKIDEAKDMLIERYLWICKQSPDSAKFMYENFNEFIKNNEKLDIKSEREFLEVYNGKSFLNGLYRIHNLEDREKWNEIIGKTFPPAMGKIMVFGYDWLGRSFAIYNETDTVLMFEPGTGEAFDTDFNFYDFHNKEIPTNHLVCLASEYYEKWRKANNNYILPHNKCAGYKVPLFLNGKDVVENLEISDMEVYWEIMMPLMNL